MSSNLSLLPILSLVVAGLAVFFGPIIQLLIARAQIRASVLSANRQQWINTLRDAIADCQTKAQISFTETHLASSEVTSSAADDKGHYEALKTMYFLVKKMALLLNPYEEDHMQLLSLLQELESFCVHGNPNDDVSHRRLQDSITLIARKILKREWQRVKKGE